MTVTVRPSRSGKTWEVDICFDWPDGILRFASAWRSGLSEPVVNRWSKPLRRSADLLLPE